MTFSPIPSPAQVVSDQQGVNPVWYGYFRGLDRFVRSKLPSVSIVSGLPNATTAGAGTRSFVTDATATTFLSVVAGGGTNKVPVVSDGTNWIIG